MSPPHVHLLYEYGADKRPFGCAHIRLLLPLSHPACASGLRVTSGMEYQEADVIILQRLWNPGFTRQGAEALIDRVRPSGARLIYEIDDALLDLEPGDLGDERSIAPEQQMMVRFLVREADAVTVTTETLRNRLLNINTRIFVVPNAIDERLFAPSNGKHDGSNDLRQRVEGTHRRKVLGFMGGWTHDADLRMVQQPVREVLTRHRDRLRFELVGGGRDHAILQGLDGLPVRVLPVGAFDEYPAFVAWMRQHLKWDVALGPLEDTPFNRCKSDLKFLDYSALGIAGVYSRITPYEDGVRHLETGVLIGENPEEWIEGLELLLTDDVVRKRIAENARQHVFSNRTLEHCAGRWKDVVRAVLHGDVAAPTAGIPGERVT